MKKRTINYFPILLILVVIHFLFYNCILPYNPFFKHVMFRPHLDFEYGNIDRLDSLESELTGALNALVFIAKRKHVKITLMYGSLIGYYFGGRILPWDDDIDVVVVGEEEILALVSLNGWESKDFVFRVNPKYSNKTTNDRWNKIDARMISKYNGVFIDVTFLWKSKSGDTHFAKDGNRYTNDMLLPLHPVVFYGIDVFVPNEIRKCLTQRYGKRVLHQGVEGFKNKGRLWEFDGLEWK
jgi:hypothetical protein